MILICHDKIRCCFGRRMRVASEILPIRLCPDEGALEFSDLETATWPEGMTPGVSVEGLTWTGD